MRGTLGACMLVLGGVIVGVLLSSDIGWTPPYSPPCEATR